MSVLDHPGQVGTLRSVPTWTWLDEESFPAASAEQVMEHLRRGSRDITGTHAEWVAGFVRRLRTCYPEGIYRDSSPEALVEDLIAAGHLRRA